MDPLFETFSSFSIPFSTILASLMKITWVLKEWWGFNFAIGHSEAYLRPKSCCGVILLDTRPSYPSLSHRKKISTWTYGFLCIFGPLTGQSNCMQSLVKMTWTLLYFNFSTILASLEKITWVLSVQDLWVFNTYRHLGALFAQTQAHGTPLTPFWWNFLLLQYPVLYNSGNFFPKNYMGFECIQ